MYMYCTPFIVYMHIYTQLGLDFSLVEGYTAIVTIPGILIIVTNDLALWLVVLLLIMWLTKRVPRLLMSWRKAVKLWLDDWPLI